MKTKFLSQLFVPLMVVVLVGCVHDKPPGPAAAKVGIKSAWPKPDKGVKVYSHPEDQVVHSNEVACFTVLADPDDTKKHKSLAYQWLRDEVPLTNDIRISGVTNATLVLSNVTLSDIAFYSCKVSTVDDTGKLGPAVNVTSVDREFPGAQLFVFVGTNTTYSGPYASGTGTKPCVGSYLGKTTFKSTTTSTWFSRPSGTTQCTATYIPGTNTCGVMIQVVDTALWSRCGSEAITFTTKAPPTYKYQFTAYVTNGPVPATLTLDLNWF